MTGHAYTVRAGTRRITPSSPGPLAGYAARGVSPSSGSHDSLEASMIWLDDGLGGSVLWLTLDAIAVSAELHGEFAAAISEVLAEPVTVISCASHTHSAPAGWSGSIHPGQLGERSPDAVAELVDAVRELAADLRAQEPAPVELSLHEPRVDGVGTNRLSPDGPHERTAGILAMSATDRTGLVAVLLDYATHPTVLPATNMRWSADWPGAARAILRASIVAEGEFAGRGAVPVIGFLQGAAGDVSTRFTRRVPDFAEAARIGSILAGDAAVALASRATPIAGRIRTRAGTVTLPVREVPARSDARREEVEAEAALAAVTGARTDPAVRLVQTRLDGARVQRALADAALPVDIELPVEIVAIGDHAWVHCPLELFASFGTEIARRSPFASTRVIGYANGYFGYLADAAAHAAGSYEALSSLFAPEAGDVFVDSVVGLLDQSHVQNSRETP